MEPCCICAVRVILIPPRVLTRRIGIYGRLLPIGSIWLLRIGPRVRLLCIILLLGIVSVALLTLIAIVGIDWARRIRVIRVWIALLCIILLCITLLAISCLRTICGVIGRIGIVLLRGSYRVGCRIVAISAR